jgi:hypothetical protein
MADALKQRGVTEPTALVVVELGVLAFRLGYARWTDPARDDHPDELAALTRAAFDELRAAVADLGLTLPHGQGKRHQSQSVNQARAAVRPR